jgi:hypothetical protein
MLNVKFNSVSKEAVANQHVVESDANNSVKLLASILEGIGIKNAFVERKSDAGRTYYSLPAAKAQQAYDKLKTILEHEPE